MTDLTSDPDRKESQLAALLECEQDLAQRLAEARAQASRIVEEARAEASAIEAEAEASFGDEALGIRAQVQERAQAEVRAVAAEAQERVARFRGVSDDDIERLARRGLGQLLGLEEGT